jgi:hypothetical protein
VSKITPVLLSLFSDPSANPRRTGSSSLLSDSKPQKNISDSVIYPGRESSPPLSIAHGSRSAESKNKRRLEINRMI